MNDPGVSVDTSRVAEPTRTTARRDEIGEAATDHVLEHGLIGLSLRPLAKSLGTSDRMLLYHFADKDDLVVDVLRRSNDRSISAIRALPPSSDPAAAVLDLWQVVGSGHVARCARIYVEASALGVLGREPYATQAALLDADWTAALADHLTASGVPVEDARDVAALVDATLMGLQLEPNADGAHGRRTAHALAEAVGRTWPRATSSDTTSGRP